ncbi:MAG: HAD family phosphatase, partial [Clostridia bacterium]|nr:HAD family phosphatase [Clostridia bacterium]
MKAVIFDMDGVLVDSEPVIIEASLRVLRKYGVEAKESDFKEFT